LAGILVFSLTLIQLLDIIHVNSTQSGIFMVTGGFMRKKKFRISKFCQCGCGRVVTPGRRFIQGHHMKRRIFSEETKRKMSEAKKGRRLPEEHKRNISKGKKGKTFSEEARRRMSEAQRGRKVSEETKRRISESLRARSQAREIS
jgi:hypothetical protein